MSNRDVFSGATLIAIGLLFLASNLGVMPEIHVARLWPVVLLVIGAGKLLTPGDDGRRSGVTLLMIGGIFLAHNYRVMVLHDSWPLFIVMAGLSILFKSVSQGSSRVKP